MKGMDDAENAWPKNEEASIRAGERDHQMEEAKFAAEEEAEMAEEPSPRDEHAEMALPQNLEELPEDTVRRLATENIRLHDIVADLERKLRVMGSRAKIREDKLQQKTDRLKRSILISDLSGACETLFVPLPDPNPQARVIAWAQELEVTAQDRANSEGHLNHLTRRLRHKEKICDLQNGTIGKQAIEIGRLQDFRDTLHELITESGHYRNGTDLGKEGFIGRWVESALTSLEEAREAARKSVLVHEDRDAASAATLALLTVAEASARALTDLAQAVRENVIGEPAHDPTCPCHSNRTPWDRR
jgi:multidrug efflux pump subunit AcrA (membrane-fusion protein)